MSDPADNGIDLYEDVGKETTHGNELIDMDSRDLYDEVLSSRVDQNNEKAKDTASQILGMNAIPSHVNSAPMRQYQLYIGNLTWWTTDADITDSVEDMGVTDFIEVKFYENVANGQSKGFCRVCVASEASMKMIMDKMPKKELQGRVPVVTYATKNALYQFESQFKCRPIPAPPPGGINGHRHPRLPHSQMTPSSGPPHHGIHSNSATGMHPMNGPPPSHRPNPPLHGTHHTSQGYSNGRMQTQGPTAPPPPIPQSMHPSSNTYTNSMPPNTSIPPPMQVPPPASAHPGAPRVSHTPPGPIPHVNPAIFPPGHPRATVASHYVPGVPPPGSHALSNAEFEAIMSRNRTVSSSAITRAVQDASCNEYGSAIETLVTAISLIKQSKVANDDRCKILISSLQDTLHGIENKSYGARRKRSRSREREYQRERADIAVSGHSRSYDRERDYREHRVDRDPEYYRERSRSREREFRGRVAEEKYYDGRDRIKREDRIREFDSHRVERDRELMESGGSRGRSMEIKRERVDYRDEIREKERERDRERIRH